MPEHRRRPSQYFVDTTANVAASSPFFALSEMTLMNLSVVESMGSRAALIAAMYMGPARLYSWGRDKGMEYFEIDNESDFTPGRFDFLYGAVTAAVGNPFVYSGMQWVNGKSIEMGEMLEHSWKAALTAGVCAPVVGYAIDVGRDLAGIKPCNRKWYPKSLTPKEKAKMTKVLLLTALGIVASQYALAYWMTPNPRESTHSAPDTQVSEESLDSLILQDDTVQF